MNLIKKIINAIIKVIFRFFAKIDNNEILFISFNGDYSDNPKYVSQAIHELDPNKKIYWILRDLNNKDVPNYVNKIKKDTIMSRKVYSRAKIIVDNNYGGKMAELHSDRRLARVCYSLIKTINNKPKQYAYTTWHGTVAKKMGIDALNTNILDFDCPNTTMILGDKHTVKIMRHLTFNKIPMRLIGTPRNDILLSANDKEEIYKKLGLESNRKYAIYAPTFRETNGAGHNDVERSGASLMKKIDFKKLISVLEKKFGGEWSIICRFHYNVSSQIDWDEMKGEFGDGIINGNKHQDMAEYLSVVDVLITDISSSVFDFMLTYKPIFLFFPDYKYYAESERGFYIEPKDLPFSISKDFGGLLSNINKFCTKKYRSGVDKLKNDFGYIENVNSAEDVAKYILDDVYGKNFKKG